MYVYIYIYIYTYVDIYISIYIHTNLSLSLCIYMYMYIYIYIVLYYIIILHIRTGLMSSRRYGRDGSAQRCPARPWPSSLAGSLRAGLVSYGQSPY